MNSKLALEHRQRIPVVTEIPTFVLGMDVSHGSPGQADIPSIAAVCLVLLCYLLQAKICSRVPFHLLTCIFIVR
jgi:hypothetical protein